MSFLFTDAARFNPARSGHFALRFSLRASLLILLGCFALLLMADRGWEIMRERNGAIADAGAEFAAAAREGVQRQADVVSQARGLLKLATSLPESDGSSTTACQTPFRRIAKDHPWLTAITIVDVSGDPVCSSYENLSARNISDREYFRQATATQDFVLSEYIISRLTNQPILQAAMPRVVNGVTQSVVLAGIDITWLSRLAAETGQRAAADVLLIDNDATVIAAYPEPERWVGKSLSAQPEFWNVLRGASGVVELAALDGNERIIGHAKLADAGAVLTVSRERSEVVARANGQAERAAAKFVFVGLFCFIAIWLGGERLVLRPIDDLTRKAARLGAGDLGMRMETDRLSPELRLLGETFNAMAAQLADRDTELQRANYRLTELAATDGLTGIANKRRFDEGIAAEWRRSVRTAEPIALLAVDVDHFKKFNDRYGHLEGDACLQEVAKVLAGACRRPADIAARSGGEEFSVLLPGASIEDAAAIAEAIRANVATLAVEHADSDEGRVTVSIGVAAFLPTPGQSARLIQNAADAALYRAKRNGRNQVALYWEVAALPPDGLPPRLFGRVALGFTTTTLPG